VREALAWRGGQVHELFVTDTAAQRNAELLQTASAEGIRISEVTDKAAASLSETVTPQGLIAVCDAVPQPLGEALRGTPRLVAVLHGVSDPGNAGTVTRVADAAGADAVIFAGDTVDPHNGKCVRASTGSLFHLPIARSRDADEVFAACRQAGLKLVAADGYAKDDLVEASARGELKQPTAWVFGSEAHGLPDDVVAKLDTSLKVPLYGAAESLNLATAAAVCLYASARDQRS
jgi:TrmH family RNA methyltransferase